MDLRQKNILPKFELFCDALGELARCGYDAEWQCIPAFAFGSTQQRFRVFVIAYPQGNRNGQRVLSTRPGSEGQGTPDTVGNRFGLDTDIGRIGLQENQTVTGITHTK